MLDESLALPLLGQTSLEESTDIQPILVDPLIYDDTIDTSTIQNVLFINSAVNDFQQYANANTFPIIYSRMSTREQLMELLSVKFQNISRIAMVCHFSEEPYFLNNELLFSDTNTQFIIDLVKQFNVTNMDFLACSTLQSEVWTSYYTKLRDETGLTIGASDDNTGNLKYGGDWILESTQEDVQTVYFNNLIQNYASLLLSITYLNLNYTTVGSNATVIAVTAAQVTALNGIISIPSTFIDNGITYNVVAIVASAFQGAAITSIIIPDSVTTIGIRVFQSCTVLKTVTLPNFITSISGYCFQWCYALTSIVIPSLVTLIDIQAFYQCVTLASINLPYGLLTIGNQVFANSALTSIIIPDTVTSIGASVFYNSAYLASVKVPRSLAAFPGGFCQGLPIPSFIFSSNVTSIGGSAFQSCQSLSFVTIPSGVTNIAAQAFFDCNALTKVYFYGNFPSTIGTNCFAIGAAHTAYYISGATGFSPVPGNFASVATFIRQTPASNVQTSILSLNTITVSWSAATPVVNVPSTGTTLQYEITYWVTSTPTITTTTPLISGTSYGITNLVNGTNYTFQLVTYNNVGPSIPNANVSKQMAPETPSAPTSFKITPRNGKILISQIVDGTNNGATIDYHSYSTSLDGISNWSTDVSFSTISTLIPSLTNEQIYYVRLNAHNSVGNSTLYSSIMSATPLINQPYTGSVTIEGTTNRYNTLTANISTIADIDELGSFSYQWNASGVDISGATSITYILTQAEVGKTVGVTVKYTDLQGTLESVPSAQTAIITALNNPPYGLVIITGTAAIRQTLTANTSIEDLDIVGSLSYQWDASGVNISGATNSTYILTLAEVGKTVGVTVKYTDGQGTLESVSSAKTSIVTYVIATSDFVFKILNSVWTGAKTLPIISSGLSFDGSATLKYSVTGPDVSSYMTVAVIYTGFTDNGTTLDGINCKTQTLNGATFSSIASFEIIQFGLFPLSRAPGAGSSTATPYGVFSDFKGKISATDIPLILPNTSLAYAFCSPASNTLASVNYGNIGSWNMSNVKDMSYMFNFATNFNQPISSWNTSNVTNMSYMFFRTDAFIQPIGVWNTSKVTNFSAMFYGTATTLFNQNLSNWDTSSATNMSLMFIGSRFNNGLAAGVGGTLTWNTRLVQDFSNMFGYQGYFNQNIGKWDTSSAVTMNSMFIQNGGFNNGAASGVLNATNNAFYWNTGNVTNMASMFSQAGGFNQHIGTFDTRKISAANMLNMFASATAFNAASTNMPRAILTNGTRYSYTTLTGYSYTSDELNASKPTGLTASRTGTILTINFTTPSYPGVNGITKYNYSINNGTNWIDASGTTSPLLISVPEMDTLTIKLRASDASNNYGAISSETIVLTFAYLPSLTAIANPINLGSVLEDASNVAISFNQLFQDTSSNSINSSVNAFIVKSVTTGSLKIGVNPWDASSNCTIDASNTAYWTPVLNANGTLAAFKIVARDALMAQSTTPFNVNVMVTAVNDRPTITSASSVTIFEKISTSTAAYTVTATDVDAGTTLLYSFNGGVDVDLFNIHSSTGVVTFKVSPKFEAPGDANTDNVYNIIVRAYDGELYSTDKEVDITVINVNDAPVAPVLINQTVIQDVSFNYTFEAFTDVDSSYGDTLSYTASNVPSWVTFNGGSRKFSGLPTNANVGTSTITVTAKDSSNATAFALFTLTVVNVNDAPVAPVLINQTMNQGVPFNYTFQAFTDMDSSYGDVLTYTASNVPSWVTFHDVSRNFSGHPTNLNVGTDTITVVATDLSGVTASASFILTIVNVNYAPVAPTLQNQTINQDVSFNYTFAAFTDVDIGDELSYTAQNVPSWVTFDPGSRNFSGLPTNANVGTSTITVTAKDSSNATANASFTLTVVKVNYAPVAPVLINQTMNQDVSFNYTFEAFTDRNTSYGDVLSYSALNVPNWVTFYDGSRNFSGLPTNANVGTRTITVIATDLSGATASATFTLTVVNVNDSPVAPVLINQTVNQDASFNYTFEAFTDVDSSYGDTLSYTVENVPSWVTFHSGSRKFSGVPTNPNVGISTITVTATDLSGVYASASFTLTVVKVNYAPVKSVLINQTMNQDVSFNYTFEAFTDRDSIYGDELSYTAENVPSWVTFDPGSRNFSGLPTNANVGTKTITVVATDSSGATANASFTLTVVNVNDAPVAPVLINQTINQDVSFNYTFEAFTDIDSSYGDTLSYTASNVPSWVTFNGVSRKFSGLPTNANVGTTTITVTAKDSSNVTAFASFTLTVVNVNDAPVKSVLINQTMNQDVSFNYTFQAFTDVDSIYGDTLSYTALNVPSWVTFDPVLRNFSGLPTNTNVGTNTITVVARDLSGATDSATFILTVVNVNDAPVAPVLINQTINQDVSFNYTFEAFTDIDSSYGDTLSYTASNAPSWVTFNGVSRKFSGLPTNANVGTNTITVTAKDSSNVTAFASFTLTVVNVNDAPVKPVLINQTMNQDVSFNYTFQAFTDVDSIYDDTLSYTALNVPSWVTFDPVLRNFSGLPRNDNVGINTITVIATDLSGATDSATFTLSVLNVNDSPTGGVSISGTVRQNQTLTADTSLLVDIDGLGSFSYQWDASGLDISGATNSTFVLTQAQVGKPIGVTIKYRDLRGFLETVSSEKTAPVENVNDAPTISSTQTVALAKGSLIKSGTTDASDIDIGAVLTWSISNKTGTYGSIDISSNTGAWQYNLLPNSAAFKALENDLSDNETFIINVSDDTSLTTFQTLKIIITGVTIAAVAPQSFRLTAGDTEITIDNVVDVSNGAIVDFHTYSKSTDGSNWGPDVSLNSTPTPTVLTGLTNGQVYYIKLKSHSTIGYSAYSKTLSVIPQVPVVIVGALLDGYIRDAIVTIQDLSGVSYGTSVITDQNGNFTVSATLQPHTIYIISSVGGTDIATNLPVTSPLTRVHITYITETTTVNISNMFTTPLTTIVANIVTGGETIAVATTKIATAMGIEESDITTDYIGVPNVAVGVAAVKVATLVNMMVAATSSQGYTGEEISKAVSQALFNSPGTGPVDFTSPSLITSIAAAADVINVAAPTITTTTATNLSSIMAQVSTTLDTIQETGSNSVSDLASIYKTSIGAQAVVTDNQNNISNITIPNVSTVLNTAINVATVGNVKGNICFRKGTKVVTDQGIIEIQKITEKNSINGKKILLVSKTTNIDDYMVLIQKDALYNNVPNADTYVTGEHKVFFNREMIKTKKLVNGTTIRKVTALNEEVYNVLLEGDNVGKMIANGLIGETLNPKSMMIELLLKLNKMGLKERTEEIHRLNYFSKMDQDRRMMKK